MPETCASTVLSSSDLSRIMDDWLRRHNMSNQDYYISADGRVVLKECLGLSPAADLFFMDARTAHRKKEDNHA